MEVNDSDGDSPENPATQSMNTVSHHYFGGSNGSEDAISVKFIEFVQSMKEEYGLFVWPCSVVLAEYVWQQRSRFAGISVLELGAGTSLRGLVASKVGADVILTDDSNRLEVMGLTRGDGDESIFSLQSQIILGADVLYDSSAGITL